MYLSAVDLYRKVVVKNHKGNIALSPFILDVSLAMLANGAAGRTYHQLSRILHYTGRFTRRCNLKEGYQKLLENLHASSYNHRLNIGHLMFVEKRFRFVRCD